MPVVSAFLVPGSPLPKLRPDIAPWGALNVAMQGAGEALAASRPDVVLVYSTQWMAVLDQLWITRPRSTGVHVDENWHEFGELAFDLSGDGDLAQGCVQACRDVGIHARGVDYDDFPIDTGTISASAMMRFGTRDLPQVLAANNIYHDNEQTERLAKLAVDVADEQDKRVSVVGIGGLSNTMFREVIDPGDDRIVSEIDDQWNRRILLAIEAGDTGLLRDMLPRFVAEARVDMGFKHFSWILGALGGKLPPGHVYEYAPLYGSGGAVVEFAIE